MRPLLLFTGLLLPQVLFAQFSEFKIGSYALTTAPAERRQGLLKLRGSDELVVKGDGIKNLKLNPDQVAFFRLGTKKYVAAHSFEAYFGRTPVYIAYAFIEQVDSGRVVLLRYEYIEGGGAPMMGAGGMMYGGGGGRIRSAYLLQSNGRLVPIPSTKPKRDGQNFQEVLLPHLRARPDLAQLVTQELITFDNLPELVRALNTNQPYATLPAAKLAPGTN